MSETNESKLTGVSFPLKPYTVKHLSELYNVSTKTFRRWLSPFTAALGDKQGYYYNISQVKIIVQRLGVPGNVMVD